MSVKEVWTRFLNSVSCNISLTSLYVVIITYPSALWWLLVYAITAFWKFPRNSFYFGLITQTSGILLSLALTIDSWKGFSDSLSLLRRSKLFIRNFLNVLLGFYLFLATHYLAFSANIASWRKPFLTMPVCIGWVLRCFCKTL